MLTLAAARRSGEHPAYSGSWGEVIGKLLDLKTLELVLETFSVKQQQLDVVVECAKTWVFPLFNTSYELACDGKIESRTWSQAVVEDTDGRSNTDSGRDILHDEEEDSFREQSDAEDIPDEGYQTRREASDEESLREIDSSAEDAPDRSRDESESFSPVVSEAMDSSDEGSGTTSVVHSGEGSDWGETWIHSANEFEVRFVTFTRRRAV